MNRIIVLSLLGILFAFSISFSEFRCDTTIINSDTAVFCSSISKSGSLRAIYKYLNGKIHGKQSEWHSNGQIKYMANYFQGEKIDTSYGYYKSGKIERINPCNGIFTYLSPEEDTLSVGPVFSGKSIGLHRQYFSANRPKRFIHYDSTGQKNGWEIFWYENGTVKDSIFFRNDSTIKRTSFYENGRLSITKKNIYGNDGYDAISYNYNGKKTGEIINGTGTIFVCDSIGGKCKKLEFKDGKRVFK